MEKQSWNWATAITMILIVISGYFAWSASSSASDASQAAQTAASAAQTAANKNFNPTIQPVVVKEEVEVPADHIEVTHGGITKDYTPQDVINILEATGNTGSAVDWLSKTDAQIVQLAEKEIADEFEQISTCTPTGYNSTISYDDDDEMQLEDYDDVDVDRKFTGKVEIEFEDVEIEYDDGVDCKKEFATVEVSIDEDGDTDVDFGAVTFEG